MSDNLTKTKPCCNSFIAGRDPPTAKHNVTTAAKRRKTTLEVAITMRGAPWDKLVSRQSSPRWWPMSDEVGNQCPSCIWLFWRPILDFRTVTAWQRWLFDSTFHQPEKVGSFLQAKIVLDLPGHLPLRISSKTRISPRRHPWNRAAVIPGQKLLHDAEEWKSDDHLVRPE